MTELIFKGKEFVYNHHLTVPFRPLEMHAGKGVGAPRLDGNLIVHGDNLHALKALLPAYAGKVDCIFIDPPYNTGNEGWCYNDNVASPMIKEWLSANPVGVEDGLRHDKWACMMWPRLRLLRELLAETGSFWMTMDENEIQHARCIMDEIFGADNFIDTVIWHKNYAPKATVKYFSSDHDYILVYAKSVDNWLPRLLSRTDEQDKAYKNLDNDPRGRWWPNNLAARNYYGKGSYSITTPSGRVIPGPPQGSYWRVSEEKLVALDADNRIWWGEDGTNVPAPKIFLSEVREGRVPLSTTLAFSISPLPHHAIRGAARHTPPFAAASHSSITGPWAILWINSALAGLNVGALRLGVGVLNLLQTPKHVRAFSAEVWDPSDHVRHDTLNCQAI